MISISEKEKRRKEIEDGLALNALDGTTPSPEAMKIYNEYIEGKLTFIEMKAKLIARYIKEV